MTKSIRLTETEAEELAHLVEGTAYAEAALMRQWVLTGMRQFRIVQAIRAYQGCCKVHSHVKTHLPDGVA